MSRQDISKDLIHFTKDIDLESAFRRLQKILKERNLIGSNGYIKGNYNCVCFSEVPLSSLAGGLVNSEYYSSYSPFGILVSKEWLYQQGGRPVIYQSDSEFDSLDTNVQWKHVRYEPPEIDFSWEREWRVKTEILEFNNQVASVVVPNSSWENRLYDEHENEQTYAVLQYSTIFDDGTAQLYYERFKWKVISLN